MKKRKKDSFFKRKFAYLSKDQIIRNTITGIETEQIKTAAERKGKYQNQCRQVNDRSRKSVFTEMCGGSVPVQEQSRPWNQGIEPADFKKENDDVKSRKIKERSLSTYFRLCFTFAKMLS